MLRPMYSPVRLALAILLAWMTLSYIRTMAGNTTPTPAQAQQVVACGQQHARCGDLP